MNEKEVLINALFIQPTRWCGLNCPGCYVKAHKDGEDSYHSLNNILDFIYNFIYLHTYKINNIDYLFKIKQLSVSIDDLSKDTYKARNMFNFIYSLNKTLSIAKTNNQLGATRYPVPEVHYTLHTLKTFESYLTSLDYPNESFYKEKFLKTPDLVSFSVLKDSDFNTETWSLARNSFKHINYNYLVPYNISLFNFNEYYNKLCKVLENVDSMYFIINKSPIGKSKLQIEVDNDVKRINKDVDFINKVMQKLSPELRSKVNIDGCLTDTIKYKQTGFGCSSNISRFQIWPDGKVSGCPYSHKGFGKIAYSSKTIAENLVQVSKQYEFKSRCHLPNIYGKLGKELSI